MIMRFAPVHTAREDITAWACLGHALMPYVIITEGFGYVSIVGDRIIGDPTDSLSQAVEACSEHNNKTAKTMQFLPKVGLEDA